MNNFIRVIILIVIFIFLVYGLVQVTTVDKAQSEVNETKKIEQFINYNRGEKYKDVLKDLPKIERVFVRSNEKRKSLVDEEMGQLYQITEDILRLEARKLDYHEWYELHSPDMKILFMDFYEHNQKENGVIYEENIFNLYIFDNKYIKLGSNAFEVIDEEALNTILEEIRKISGLE